MPGSYYKSLQKNKIVYWYFHTFFRIFNIKNTNSVVVFFSAVELLDLTDVHGPNKNTH